MNPLRPPEPALRAVRPDAENADAIFLVKNVTFLRATYQIRLLAYLAAERGKQLVLKVPAGCRFDGALTDLMAAPRSTLRREDLP